MIWIAGRQQGWNWMVYHRGMPDNKNQELNNNSGDTNAAIFVNSNNTTHFTISSNGMVNNNGYNYIAFIFGHDSQEFGKTGRENIIYCGDYTGTGSDQTIDIGFEPQFLLIKATKPQTQIGDCLIPQDRNILESKKAPMIRIITLT